MKGNCALLAVVLVLALGVHAQTDEKELVERHLRDLYKGNVITLRDSPRGDKLRFGADGKLLEGGQRGPWSLYAKVEIADVRLEKETLRFTGNRLYMVFDDKKGEFRYLRGGKVTIDIEIPPEDRTLAGVQEHMAKVFMPANELVSDEMLQSWREEVRGRNVVPNRKPPAEEEGDKSSKDANGDNKASKVSAPICIFCPDPEYSREARKGGVEGIVVLWCVVNKDGRAEKIRVAKPLGAGLDEAAVKAVRTWRFDPAKRDGKAVEVYMKIEVNFHR